MLYNTITRLKCKIVLLNPAATKITQIENSVASLVYSAARFGDLSPFRLLFEPFGNF